MAVSREPGVGCKMAATLPTPIQSPTPYTAPFPLTARPFRTTRRHRNQVRSTPRRANGQRGKRDCHSWEQWQHMDACRREIDTDDHSAHDRRRRSVTTDTPTACRRAHNAGVPARHPTNRTKSSCIWSNAPARTPADRHAVQLPDGVAASGVTDREANQSRISCLLAVGATSTNRPPLSRASRSSSLTNSGRCTRCGTITSRPASRAVRAIAIAIFLATARRR
jgi:hypothetical protein